MIVMPSNNSKAHELEQRFPGRLGLLMSPVGRRNPKTLPYALDNGMYSAWKKSGYSSNMSEQRGYWDGCAFLDLLTWACEQDRRPLWVVVPDVPGNRDETLREFDLWAPEIEKTGIPLAMAVQDGMTPEDVPGGVICFVGGSTDWKWRHGLDFPKALPRVHFGRVNFTKGLYLCDMLGVESADGTGWFRGDQKQIARLECYLRHSSSGKRNPLDQPRLFPQLDHEKHENHEKSNPNDQ